MAIHEVDIFFYLKKCSGESGTVFIDYKTVLRDELNFFCFVMTADFSLRLKLQEQQQSYNLEGGMTGLTDKRPLCLFTGTHPSPFS